MNKVITLYLNPLTANSIKMLFICNALGINVEYQHVQLHKGEHHSDTFLKLNPEAKVPVLIDNALTLTESNAILHYLAAKHHSSFWPTLIAEQSQVLKVMFWQANDFSVGVGPYAHRRVVMPQWGFDKVVIAEKEEQKFHHALTTLETILEKRPALAGEVFSIADMSVASFMIFTGEAEMPMDNYTATLDWLARLKNQPWFKRTQQQLHQVRLSETKTLSCF